MNINKTAATEIGTIKYAKFVAAEGNNKFEILFKNLIIFFQENGEVDENDAFFSEGILDAVIGGFI